MSRLYMLPILFCLFDMANAGVQDETVVKTVGGKLKVEVSETKLKPYEVRLDGKLVHEEKYTWFKIENSYKDGLSSYVVAYGYTPIGASRCRTEIVIFDIGKYGYDKHYIPHHGGVRCWEGPVFSSLENSILKIKAGDEMFLFKDDRYGNKEIVKEES